MTALSPKRESYPETINPRTMELLEAPFNKIGWRPQKIIFSQKTQKSYGIMMAFITARNVIDRLNEVVGAGGWEFSWVQVPTGTLKYKKEEINYPNRKIPAMVVEETKFVVRGTLKVLGKTKEDVGYPNSDDDRLPIKSAVSDALKRCAVQFGIGKFLYDLDNKLIEYDPTTKKPTNPKDLEKLENMFQSA